MSPRGWRPTSPGAAVSDALLDPVARGRVVDRLDLAALQVGNDPLQALPPPIHVQQGLGLVEDPVVFDGLGHGLSVSADLEAAGELSRGTDRGRLRRGRLKRPPAAARYGFALGGGNALIAHGVIDRPTEDIDLFTDREHGVAAAADAVEAALRRAGYTAERQDKTAGLSEVFEGMGEGLAEWIITTPDGAQLMLQMGSPYHPAKKQRLGSRPGYLRGAAGLPGLAARGRPGRLGVLHRGLLFGGRGAGGDQRRVLRR
jgi:Nucleotidyl transferase AbiEii toxin, Type IV TA system